MRLEWQLNYIKSQPNKYGRSVLPDVAKWTNKVIPVQDPSSSFLALSLVVRTHFYAPVAPVRL